MRTASLLVSLALCAAGCAPDWRTYSSETGRFQVQLPSSARELHFEVTTSRGVVHFNGWGTTVLPHSDTLLGNLFAPESIPDLAASYAVLDATEGRRMEEIFNEVVESYKRESEGIGVPLVARESFSKNGCSGIKLEYAFRGVWYVSCFCRFENRIYRLSAGGLKEERRDPAVERFLSSFAVGR